MTCLKNVVNMKVARLLWRHKQFHRNKLCVPSTAWLLELQLLGHLLYIKGPAKEHFVFSSLCKWNSATVFQLKAFLRGSCQTQAGSLTGSGHILGYKPDQLIKQESRLCK